MQKIDAGTYEYFYSAAKTEVTADIEVRFWVLTPLLLNP